MRFIRTLAAVLIAVSAHAAPPPGLAYGSAAPPCGRSAFRAWPRPGAAKSWSLESSRAIAAEDPHGAIGAPTAALS
jgi:hypothetical protein